LKKNFQVRERIPLSALVAAHYGSAAIGEQREGWRDRGHSARAQEARTVADENEGRDF